MVSLRLSNKLSLDGYRSDNEGLHTTRNELIGLHGSCTRCRRCRRLNASFNQPMPPRHGTMRFYELHGRSWSHRWCLDKIHVEVLGNQLDQDIPIERH